MRAMWRAYGKPGGPAPGLVGHPYSLDDVREQLADVSGDRAFADDFMKRYITGREVVDYARLAARAGVALEKTNPGGAWLGDLAFTGGTTLAELVPPGTPAYAAGLEQDDQITALDGKPVSSAVEIADVLHGHKPGDTVTVAFTRRDGPATATVTLAEDPTFGFRLDDHATAEQLAFRNAWLGAR
jgi:predicted metalloprotease with PDZ domain